MRSIILAVLLVMACVQRAEGQTRRPPRGAEAFSPPAEYRAWWDRLASTVDDPATAWDDLHWYVVAGRSFPCGAARCEGMTWYTQDGAVVIFVASAAQSDRSLVEHEMLHALYGPQRHPFRFSRGERLDAPVLP